MDIDALSIGIYNVFVADSDLKTALGGDTARRMYDTKAPQNPDVPYAVFQFIAGIEEFTFDALFEVTTWQFSIFHKDEDPLDKTTINDVFKKLAAAYDLVSTMTVTGYTVIQVIRLSSNFLQTEDQTQQYVIDYEIRIQKSR